MKTQLFAATQNNPLAAAVKRTPGILKAVLAALAVAVLLVLLSPSIGEMRCANGDCIEVIAAILVYAFPVCLIAVAVLHMLAGSRQTPRAGAINRIAAWCLTITKAIYVFVMASALALIFTSSLEVGASPAAVFVLLMSAPVCLPVMLAAEIMGMADRPFFAHAPLALHPESIRDVAVWLAFFIAGWWQWFIAVPALYAWRHPKMRQKINVSEKGGWRPPLVAASEGDAGAVRGLLDEEAKPSAAGAKE